MYAAQVKYNGAYVLIRNAGVASLRRECVLRLHTFFYKHISLPPPPLLLSSSKSKLLMSTSQSVSAAPTVTRLSSPSRARRHLLSITTLLFDFEFVLPFPYGHACSHQLDGSR